jgi:lipopolysaccharide transport system ATP-binding protein
MSKVVVHAEGLGKKYVIRHQGKYGYVALRDVLTEGVGNGIRRLARRQPAGDGATREEFWALRDVGFELRDGERLGLIGRNGAGKSTLLKILSRITEPTEGMVRLRGRVASLLEVGTGFHPELTGRENVFLNGTILGMRRSEIRRKLDEIVAFAEVEKFLDTPVKRYSSGMYVRLAFAVAAHLEQEILLVDEVLAVGDAVFQQKCLTKMGEVADQGRTIVLVSHNLVAIEQLCTTAIWLEGGRMVQQGPAEEIVDAYNASFAPKAMGTFEDSHVTGDGSVELRSYTVLNEHGSPQPLPVTGEDVLLQVSLRVHRPIQRPAAGVSVWSPGGALLTSLNTTQLGQEFAPWQPGDYLLTVRLAQVPYMPGPHRVDFWVHNPGGDLYAHVEDAITFEIGQSPIYGTTEVTAGFGAVYTRVEVTVDPREGGAAGSVAGDVTAGVAVPAAGGGEVTPTDARDAAADGPGSDDARPSQPDPLPGVSARR